MTNAKKRSLLLYLLVASCDISLWIPTISCVSAVSAAICFVAKYSAAVMSGEHTRPGVYAQFTVSRNNRNREPVTLPLYDSQALAWSSQAILSCWRHRLQVSSRLALGKLPGAGRREWNTRLLIADGEVRELSKESRLD